MRARTQRDTGFVFGVPERDGAVRGRCANLDVVAPFFWAQLFQVRCRYRDVGFESPIRSTQSKSVVAMPHSVAVDLAIGSLADDFGGAYRTVPPQSDSAVGTAQDRLVLGFD